LLSDPNFLLLHLDGTVWRQIEYVRGSSIEHNFRIAFFVSLRVTKHVTARLSGEFVIAGVSESVNLIAIDGEGNVIAG